MKQLSFGTLIAFIAGIIFIGGLHTTIEATNTLEFCISCHEMESTVYQEYKERVHYRNSTGIQVACADCHVPKPLGQKLLAKIKASSDLYYSLTGSIDTTEKFSDKRLQMAKRVWRWMEETDSANCRSCHNFTSSIPAGQGLFASSRHAKAQENGQTCIDCHKGIAHQLPERPTPESEKSVVAEEQTEGEQPWEYDPDYADEINETCAGCHGEWGEGSLDGEYPRLAGFPPPYIEKQLGLFKKRERLNIPMVPYTNERELPAGDIKTIARFLSEITLPTQLTKLEEGAEIDSYERLLESKAVLNIPRYTKGNVSAGKWIYNRECATCHGGRGEGKGVKIPPLAGQHSLYLIRQVNQFRKGDRLHDLPEDQDIFKQLTDDDLKSILAYLSILDD